MDLFGTRSGHVLEGCGKTHHAVLCGADSWYLYRKQRIIISVALSRCGPHFGAWQAKDMQIHMEDVMSTLPLEIIQGNRLVEVRHVGVNKSLVLEEVLRQGPRNGYDPPPPVRGEDSPAQEIPAEDFDFVLCVGDDRSDEDMYQLLKSWHSRRCEAIDHEDDRAPDLYNVHIGPGRRTPSSAWRMWWSCGRSCGAWRRLRQGIGRVGGDF